jgi:hypothetical protein
LLLREDARDLAAFITVPAALENAGVFLGMAFLANLSTSGLTTLIV